MNADVTTEPTQSWEGFAGQTLDAALFIKLIAVCEGVLPEAVVLWDLIAWHRTTKLDTWRKRSGSQIVLEYGTEFGNERAVRRAVVALDEIGLIELGDTVRNVAQKLRLNWPELEVRLSRVSAKLPGLSGVCLPEGGQA